MTTILVTGAGGFVGRSLLRSPAWERVRAVVRSPFPAPEAVEFVRADLSQPGWTAALDGPADVVVSLAQSGRFRDFPDGARDMFLVNEAAVFELLEWSRRNGVRRFVQASTGSVYAALDSPGDLAETHPCVPRSLYAASKLNAENLVRQYAQFFTCVIARLFTVYGPGQRGMLIANMIDRVVAGQPIRLDQGVGPTMTPIYGEDCAGALARLTETALPENTFVVNVAGPERLTLADVVARIAAGLGREAVLEKAAGVPEWLAADTRCLRAILPGLAFTPFDFGLDLTLRAFAGVGAAAVRG